MADGDEDSGWHRSRCAVPASSLVVTCGTCESPAGSCGLRRRVPAA